MTIRTKAQMLNEIRMLRTPLHQSPISQRTSAAVITWAMSAPISALICWLVLSTVH